MKKKKLNLMPWIFNSPYIIYSLVFLFLPLGWALWLSVTDWNLMSPKYDVVKLENFMKLFTDEKVHAAFGIPCDIWYLLLSCVLYWE